MPFKSEKQRKWMHANKPKMAKDWEKKESINEGNPLELGKLRDAILMFKKKIEKQGMVKNARDEDHLERLIKIYNKMGGKKIKEGFGGELKGKDKEKFEKAREENAEQLGYKLTGVSDIREANYWGGAKHMVQLPKSKMFFNPTNQNFWLMGPDGGPDWDDEPISPGDSDYKRTLQRLSSADKSAVKKSMRGKGNWKESVNEAENKIADIRKILKTKKGKRIDSIFMDVETAKKVIKYYKSLKGSAKEKFVKQKIQNIVKSVNEKKLVGRPMVKKAIQIAKKMSGNMTGAVKKIEKMMPGLSKQIEVEDALRKANESINEAQNKIADMRKIVKTKKGKRIDSIFMDVETAAAIIKKYKSLGKHQRQKFITQKIQNIVKSVDESINEANIKDIEKVLKTRSAKKIDGMYMDMTTANAIMTVYKALNTTNKKKFAKLPLKKMVTVTWKLVK